MLDWLQLLNPLRHHHLLPPGAAGATALPCAQWLVPVLAAARLAGPPSATAALTLLAPSDQALRAAGVVPGELPRNELQHWLMRHLSADDARSGGLLQMLDGQLLRPGGTARQWRDSAGGVVQQLGRTGEVAGLRVLVVDRALPAVTASLWERIAADPNRRRFAAALEHTGLAALLNCNGPFTVLAPSSRGLARAAARLGLSPAALWADRTLLTRLLSGHLLPGRLPSSAFPWGGAMHTLAGQTLQWSALGLLRSGDLLLPLVAGSDVSCSNGVLHCLDEVLLPPDD
ncbi:MAG: fasciclin domain-containing protein [Roseateles sp.]|uniref:fasciclin domain-containing protein n=1 Tax=Roseateles sp. TaxID=1971397 RepID=UPI004034F9D8